MKAVLCSVGFKVVGPTKTRFIEHRSQIEAEITALLAEENAFREENAKLDNDDVYVSEVFSKFFRGEILTKRNGGTTSDFIDSSGKNWDVMFAEGVLLDEAQKEIQRVTEQANESMKSVDNVESVSYDVGQKVKAKVAMYDDLRDHGLGVNQYAKEGDILIIRSIAMPGKMYYVSHEHVTDRTFFANHSELEKIA